MTAQPPVPRVLSIAGSDSGGGAGIQADLKAFAACGVHGMTAITAITAQNTVGVRAIESVPPAMILAQVRAVAGDIGLDAVKIGMLGTVATIEAVSTALGELPPGMPIVLDPVMVAESGAELLAPEARQALIELLLPRATVATPNIPESVALAGLSSAASASADANTADADADTADADADTDDARGNRDPRALALSVHALGPAAVVVTGGHRDSATDLFYDGEQFVELTGERHRGGAAHGSGCTHSSVLAACLAWGWRPLDAARCAKQSASAAVRDGLRDVGAGPGPVDVLGLAGRIPRGSGC